MYLFILFIVIALGRMKAFLLNLLVGGGGAGGVGEGESGEVLLTDSFHRFSRVSSEKLLPCFGGLALA